MKKKKGREIQMKYLIKSAIAQKYYQSLNREYDTEAARKQFNQDNIDPERLVEVIKEAMEEEIEQLNHKNSEDV